MADARRLHVVVPTHGRPVAPGPGWGMRVVRDADPRGSLAVCPVP
jgi:hypothetical protein